MNAQGYWKLAYRQYMFAAAYRVRADGFRGMYRYRREAALERRIAALERQLTAAQSTIQANVERIAELELECKAQADRRIDAEHDRSRLALQLFGWNTP